MRFSVLLILRHVITSTCTYLPIPSVVFSDYKIVLCQTGVSCTCFSSVCFTKGQIHFTYLLFNSLHPRGAQHHRSLSVAWVTGGFGLWYEAPLLLCVRSFPTWLWFCSFAIPLSFALYTSLAERTVSSRAQTPSALRRAVFSLAPEPPLTASPWPGATASVLVPMKPCPNAHWLQGGGKSSFVQCWLTFYVKLIHKMYLFHTILFIVININGKHIFESIFLCVYFSELCH